MLRALPILWFLVAALGAAAKLAVAGADYLLVPNAATAFASAVTGIGFGLVYLLIFRTRPSPAVTIIGYSHLFMAIAARVASALADIQRTSLLEDPLNVPASSVTIAYTASGLANLLGGIVFILALIVALNTHHERPEDVF